MLTLLGHARLQAVLHAPGRKKGDAKTALYVPASNVELLSYAPESMPQSLLAVLLCATHQSKHQIVFAYPAHPTPLPRTSRPTYGKLFALADRMGEGEDEEAEDLRQGRRKFRAPPIPPEETLPEGQGTPPIFGESSWLLKDKRKDEHAEPDHEYLGFNAETLADALLPNHTKLYNEKFELVINHLAFIGHPVHLDSTRGKQRRDSSAQVMSSPIATIDQSIASLDAFSFTSSGPATDEPSLSRTQTRSSVSTQHQGSTEKEPLTKLDRFNLVLVVDTPPDKDLSRQLDIYYRDIVVKMTAALKGEERRSDWLSLEAKRCRRIKADYRPDQIDTMTAKLISASPLCSALAEIFDSVTERKVAHLQNLNGNLDMSILLHDELLDGKPLVGYRDVGDVDVFDPSQPPLATDSLLSEPSIDGAPRLARWHAILPLEDPVAMLDELETGLVAEFVSMLTPRLNIAEYEMLLDVDTATVAHIVHHLVYWRKARVIGVLNLQDVITPRSDFDMRRLPDLSREWARTFPFLGPLPSLLAAMSSHTPFKRVIPQGTDRLTAFDALVWLLRHDIVIQLHVYARVVATPAVRRAAQRAAGLAQIPTTPTASSADNYIGKTPDSLKDAVDEEDEGDDRASSVINEPSRPSQLERRWLQQIVVGKPPNEVDHFRRMLPYLNGRYHLEAIMIQTSLGRREIRDVLDAFSSEVVTFLSPATAV